MTRKRASLQGAFAANASHHLLARNAGRGRGPRRHRGRIVDLANRGTCKSTALEQAGSTAAAGAPLTGSLTNVAACSAHTSTWQFNMEMTYIDLTRRHWLAAAHKLTAPQEILLWMTPSEAPKALQASECSELLDPMRASCWIFAQH